MEEKDTKKFSTFKKAIDGMVAINSNTNSYWSGRLTTTKIKDYNIEDIKRILSSGSLIEQQRLSKNYFDKDGFYKRIIIHYATLLKYSGMLIPHFSQDKKLKEKVIKGKYEKALTFIENMRLQDFFTNCSLKALIYGGYYGIITSSDKKGFTYLDLPSEYCCSRFKNSKGINIVEFNLGYFDTIIDEDLRKKALTCYPKIVSRSYEKYKSGKEKQWIYLPSDSTICFTMFDNGIPPLLNVINSTINYEDSLELEKERDWEEIKKIIVQKVPHNNQNELLFEPEEAEVMHQGATNMLKGNKNISVLTTYTDVDCISSKTQTDSVSNNLDKMVNNIYYEAGVSGLLFGNNSNSALDPSIKNDIGFMSLLTNKYENFMNSLLNRLFGGNNISFKYIILPVTRFNDDKYIENTYKLANSGYSFLMPALASGLSQKDLVCVKDLENNLLQLGEKLIPLQSAFTRSSSDNEGAGAPKKEEEEKSQQTQENEKSLDKQGVIGNE